LNARRVARGITLAMVATEAATTAKTGTCSIPTASRALSGDEPNANVVNALKRLLDAAPAVEQQSKAS
jgi:hypothetical protein